MASQETGSLGRSLLLSLVPVIVGSFLIAGVAENFKTDTSLRKDVFEQVYRPMREAQMQCRKQQSQLEQSFAQLAGSYQLLLGEFDHMTSRPGGRLTEDYKVYATSLLKNNFSLSDSIRKESQDLQACQAKLLLLYEEMGVLTGTFRDVQLRIATRDRAIETIDREQAAATNKVSSQINIDDAISQVRQMLSSDAAEPLDKAGLRQKLHAFGAPVISLYEMLSNNERKRREAESALDLELIAMFSNEISARFKRGFFSNLLR
ncbi:hypothetical protein GO998_01355 [Ralstonia syzygii]|uniref:Uncharacterized protein n=1 Tax=Ralstonia syzygii TaxID=28097 RepID=A0ABX7ZCE1_9RALS|nr:hypothetical protein [Ralstonia syzygii]QUP52494.1 hypothetical protein GO998_01355 [Ralstonia syzygii]